jgi:hypothetical protein
MQAMPGIREVLVHAISGEARAFWEAIGNIRCEEVDDPIIQNDRDAIIKVTSCVLRLICA